MPRQAGEGEEEADPTKKVPDSYALYPIAAALRRFDAVWKGIDERRNPEQRHVESVIISETKPTVEDMVCRELSLKPLAGPS